MTAERKLPCEYCGTKSTDDSRGCCSNCGAPRNLAYTLPSMMLPFFDGREMTINEIRKLDGLHRLDCVPVYMSAETRAIFGAPSDMLLYPAEVRR